MFVDPCEQDEIAADFSDLLTQPCTIEHKGAPIKDQFGASSSSYTSLSTMCRVLVLKSPREGLQAAQITTAAQFEILLPLHTAVSAKDRVLSAGQKYEVVATDAGVTDAFYLKIYASKVS